MGFAIFVCFNDCNESSRGADPPGTPIAIDLSIFRFCCAMSVGIMPSGVGHPESHLDGVDILCCQGSCW